MQPSHASGPRYVRSGQPSTRLTSLLSAVMPAHPTLRYLSACSGMWSRHRYSRPIRLFRLSAEGTARAFPHVHARDAGVWAAAVLVATPRAGVQIANRMGKACPLREGGWLKGEGGLRKGQREYHPTEVTEYRIHLSTCQVSNHRERWLALLCAVCSLLIADCRPSRTRLKKLESLSNSCCAVPERHHRDPDCIA